MKHVADLRVLDDTFLVLQDDNGKLSLCHVSHPLLEASTSVTADGTLEGRLEKGGTVLRLQDLWISVPLTLTDP